MRYVYSNNLINVNSNLHKTFLAQNAVKYRDKIKVESVAPLIVANKFNKQN